MFDVDINYYPDEDPVRLDLLIIHSHAYSTHPPTPILFQN